MRGTPASLNIKGDAFGDVKGETFGDLLGVEEVLGDAGSKILGLAPLGMAPLGFEPLGVAVMEARTVEASGRGARVARM